MARLLLLVGSLAVIGLLAGPARARQGTALAFRWPDHLVCEVERRTRISSGAPDRHPLEASDRHRLEAQRQRDGWLVKRTYLGGIDARGARESARRMEEKGDRLPSFRLRADGAFAGLALDAAARERLRVRQAEWRARVKENALERGLRLGQPEPGSEAELLAHARSEWTDLVQAWAGAVLAAGEPVTKKGRRELALPFVGRQSVEARERRSLVAGVACVEGGPATCVALETVTEPELADLNRSLAASGRARPAPGPDEPTSVQVTRFQLRRTLITDPATLVPARLTRSMDMEIAREGGPSSREETTTFACSSEP
jgi:hypothetical protein